MKNKTIFIAILVVILGIILTIVVKDLYEKYYINQIEITKTVEPVETETDISQYFEEEGTFILVLGDTRCSYCNHYKENTLTYYINDTPKYPLRFVYLNEIFDSKKDWNDYLLNYGIAITSTPTTFLVIDGKVEGIITGDIGLFKLYDFVKDHR